MGNRKSLVKDNQGSTFLLVIICIAFISILGTILLSAAVTNIQMKEIEQKAKANFYETESAIDEIKAGLEEITAEELDNAYTTVMKSYLGKTDTERKELFDRTFIQGIHKKLGGMENAVNYKLDTIRSFIKNGDYTLITASGENLLVTGSRGSDWPESVTLKNIKVSFTNRNHYETTISTDITIHTPKLGFAGGEAVSELPILQYSLIADNRILADTALDVKVTGNLYAGTGGINLYNNSNLQINNSSKIITRGDISAGNFSSLTIEDNPSIWANNIVTLKGNDTENPTVIKINGTCYVADDLMLNAKYSDLTIKGKYFGYSYGTMKGTGGDDKLIPQNSSAIMINGANSSIDMMGVTDLLLAGRAYLNPNSRDNKSTDTQGKVYTGESVAVKGNQYAYLVPGENMWCGSNPVPKSVYENRPAKEVDYTKNNGSIDLSQYADGFSNIFYKDNNQELVYYYLKFKSEEKANEYLQKYYEVNNSGDGIGIIDKRIKSFAAGIKFKNPVNSLLTAGNIFTFQQGTGKSSLIPNNVIQQLNADGTKNDGLKALEEITGNLAGRYDTLIQKLTEEDTAPQYDSDSVFRNFIKIEDLVSDAVTNQNGFTDGIKRVSIDGENVIYLVNNAAGADFTIPTDLFLPNNGRKGFVIATGSVKVDKDYTGMIFSGDTIKLGAGVKVNASGEEIEKLLASTPEVNRYLRNYTAKSKNYDETGSQTIKIADLIELENWKKY